MCCRSPSPKDIYRTIPDRKPNSASRVCNSGTACPRLPFFSTLISDYFQRTGKLRHPGSVTADLADAQQQPTTSDRSRRFMAGQDQTNAMPPMPNADPLHADRLLLDRHPASWTDSRTKGKSENLGPAHRFPPLVKRPRSRAIV